MSNTRQPYMEPRQAGWDDTPFPPFNPEKYGLTRFNPGDTHSYPRVAQPPLAVEILALFWLNADC